MAYKAEAAICLLVLCPVIAVVAPLVVAAERVRNR